jgi:membrane-associated progesterone receptor component
MAVAERESFREYTAAELAAHTGAGGVGAILVALDGVVYDLASHPTGRDFYGPGQGYSVFAGRDATFGLATMSVDPSTWPAAGSCSFTSAQQETLASWAARFGSKYRVMGWLAGSTIKDAAALREKLEGGRIAEAPPAAAKKGGE